MALRVVGLCALLVIVALPLKNSEWSHYAPQRLSLEELAHLARKVGWKADRFEVEPGVHLAGLVKEPSSPEAAWLLFFPGNGGQLNDRVQHLLESLDDARGFGLGVWASRGFDASEGMPSAEAFHHDALAEHRRLVGHFGAAAEHIHVIGFSMGAEVAWTLAADLAARRKAPPSVTLLSSYTPAYRMLAPSWYARWAPWPDRYDAAARLGEITSPVLIVHGRDDDLHPVAQARDLARSLGGRAQYVEVAGGHSAPLEDARSRAAVRRFLGETTVRAAM